MMPTRGVPHEKELPVPDEGRAVEALGQAVDFHRFAAKAGGDGPQLQRVVLRADFPIPQGFVPFDAGPAFGAAARAPRPSTRPPGAAGSWRLRSVPWAISFPLGLQLEKAGIVGFVDVQPAMVDFRDFPHHPVEKVPIVGDHQDGAFIFLQIVLEPDHHPPVQVVGRLVQNEQLAGGNEGGGHGHPLFCPPDSRDTGRSKSGSPRRVRMALASNSLWVAPAACSTCSRIVAPERKSGFCGR